MKRLLTIISIMIAISSATSCKKASSEADPASAPLITKPEVVVQDGHFTPEIMHSLAKVSDPQISPDGTKILYGVGYTSIEQNKSNRELFVMNIDGSNKVQLTTTPQSENNARWIEDGKRIAFLRGGQMWVMNSDGTSEKQVSNIPDGMMEFKLSPDGTKVLYSANFKVVKSPAEIHPDLPKSTARTIEGLMYRHWDHFVETIPHTYLADFDGNTLGEGVDLLGGAPYELPAEPFSGIEQLDFSPEGDRIVYSCRKKTGREYAFSTNSDIYLLTLSDNDCVNISEGMMGYDTNPLFSPDGGTIAWMSMERDGYEADKIRLFVYDIASGKRRELSASFKYNIENPVWMPDSKGLYFTSLVEGLQEIWMTDLEGNMSRVTPEREWYNFGAPSLLTSTAEDGSVKVERLIATNLCMLRPAEIVSINPQDGSWEQLTFENKYIFDQLDEVTVEERWIRTSDNKKMLTWVLYPPKFDKSKVYPSILLCLGGPQGTLSQGWSYRWNYRLMASQGYIVVLPNRRGTTAFGQEWCEQISGDYIGQNMRDYFAAADALKAEPYVGKMAAVGASYGGYSVFYLAGIHQKRFDAFIAHAGIFNVEHMYMTTEEMWFPDWDNGGIAQPGKYMAGSPWSNNPVAKRHYANSPHKLVEKWDTPILITHGELDYRVPVDQGMAAFNAAQMMGVPSRMILFPDENHWILKPQNSIHWNREFFTWLDTYLK